MPDRSISAEQLEALLRYASQRLGTTPEQLAQTVQSGDVAKLVGNDTRTAQTIDAVLHDKGQADALLRSPQAQRILSQIFGKKES